MINRQYDNMFSGINIKHLNSIQKYNDMVQEYNILEKKFNKTLSCLTELHNENISLTDKYNYRISKNRDLNFVLTGDCNSWAAPMSTLH